MVVVKSVMSSQPTTAAVIADLGDQIDAAGVVPDFVFAFYSHSHDDAALSDLIRDRFGDVAVVGGTSCGGVMGDAGLSEGPSVGLLLVADPDGAYGAAAAPLGDDPAAAAQTALAQALDAADSPGELPELVWIYQSPGQEEAVVEGLRRIVGDRCPIIGGSAADDDVAGLWRQLGPDGPLIDGVVVGVLFSSGGIGVAFQGGYEPTGTTGVVTELGFDSGEGGVVTSASGRNIRQIDGEPAAVVYDRWTGGVLGEDVLRDGGTILAATTMTPLGLSAGRVDEVTRFRLVHPETVTPEGGLTTFARVERGDRIFGMRGDRDRLVQRVGRVTSAAIASLSSTAADVAGGLVVYCGGCRLAVGDQVDMVAKTAGAAFGGLPFIGCFTFGEQGQILDENVHANLMISAIAFGR
ncbi:FIST signal transduction protein [Euzebya sp.]|uniref:FIST signal transduction protein n=1 Tax=Euzebya sp. TaxID=1971409 RepID=UPI003511B2C7